MKKEFKSIEKITCRFAGLKDENSTTKCFNLVSFKIRMAELERLEQDKDYKNILSTLDEQFSADAGTATDKQIVTACDNDKELAELFKAHAKLVKDAKAVVEAIPVKLDDFNALAGTDKAFILLECHKNMKSINLEVEGNFEKAINAFFNTGELKKVKELCRTAFHKSIGTDGELFYGVKLKRSDFKDADIRKAFGQASKGASRKIVKDSKTKAETLKNYDWNISHDSKTVNSIVSSLFAVVIESRKDELVFNKPEEPKQETKDSKPETTKGNKGNKGKK